MTNPVRKAATCGVGPSNNVCGKPGHMMVALQTFDDLQAFEANEAPLPRLAVFCVRHVALAELTPLPDGRLETLVTRALQDPEWVLDTQEVGRVAPKTLPRVGELEDAKELWAARARAVMATLMAAGWRPGPWNIVVGDRVRFRHRVEGPWRSGLLQSLHNDERGAEILTDTGDTVTMGIRVEREESR